MVPKFKKGEIREVIKDAIVELRVAPTLVVVSLVLAVTGVQAFTTGRIGPFSIVAFSFLLLALAWVGFVVIAKGFYNAGWRPK